MDKEKKGFIGLVLHTGFWGGMIWSFIGQIGYYFHFTKISPRVVLEPWALGSWKNGWLGILISILLISIISIGAAVLYSVLLKKFSGMLPGLGYGLLIFLVVFILLNPMFPGISPFRELDKNTLVTAICLFILYGVFIGYSISWEYDNVNRAEEISE